MNQYHRWLYTDQAQLGSYKKAVGGVGLLAISMLGMMYAVLFGGVSLATVVIEILTVMDPAGGTARAIGEAMAANGTGMLALQSLTTALAMGVPCLAFIKIRRKRSGDYFSLRPALPPKAISVLIVSIGLLYCASVIGAMFWSGLRLFGIQLKEPELALPTTALGMVLNILAVAILPPLFEEFAFRGVILGELLPYGATPAIVISAILFGAIHGTPMGYFYATMAGLVFGWIRVKTNSIFYPILVHAVFNGLSVFFQFISERFPDSAELYMSAYQTGFFAIALILLFRLIAKRYDLSLNANRSDMEPSTMRKASMRPSIVLFVLITLCLAAFGFELI